MDSMKEKSPDYSRILDLVKEVRDELSGMAPQNWKQEIFDSIDVDILSQVRTHYSHECWVLLKLFVPLLICMYVYVCLYLYVCLYTYIGT